MKALHLPRLNEHQLEKLSDITSDVGLISLAVVLLPAVLDKLDPIRILLGVLGTIFFWLISLWIRK